MDAVFTLRQALRLGRMLGQLLPGESEVHALLALMELHASRTAARRGSNGEAVLLPDQDRSLWDHAQIQRGMTSLEHAQRLGGEGKYYALQAAITACHMRARTAEETDWERIVLLYDALLQSTASPIVALNRAVAVGMAQGPAAGLEALDAITNAGDSALAGYHLLHSVRGDLLMKIGRLSESREDGESPPSTWAPFSPAQLVSLRHAPAAPVKLRGSPPPDSHTFSTPFASTARTSRALPGATIHSPETTRDVRG